MGPNRETPEGGSGLTRCHPFRVTECCLQALARSPLPGRPGKKPRCWDNNLWATDRRLPVLALRTGPRVRLRLWPDRRDACLLHDTVSFKTMLTFP